MIPELAISFMAYFDTADNTPKMLTHHRVTIVECQVVDS